MTEQPAAYTEDCDPVLARMAEQLEGNALFMASVLRNYRRQEGKSRAAQQELLGVDETGFVRLALCRRPSADAALFRTQVEQIARYTGAQIAPLVELIRRADAVAGMEPRTMDMSGAAERPRATTRTVMPMAAARDRISESQVDYAAPPERPAPPEQTSAAQPSAPESQPTPSSARDARPTPGREESPHDSSADAPPPAPDAPKPPEPPNDAVA